MAATEEAMHDSYEGANSSRRLELLFALLALAGMACYLALSLRIELRRETPIGQIDARFWPIILGIAGVAAAVALVAVAVSRPAPSREEIERLQPGGVSRMLLTLATVGAFIAAWSASTVVVFGYRFELFPIASALLLTVLMLIYGHRRWPSLIVYSVSVAAFVYVVFGMLLRIPL